MEWRGRTYSWTGSTPPPPLGLNTWNAFHVNIDENIVLALADAFDSLGLKAAGYEYINIDDGFVPSSSSPRPALRTLA
jgi:alpha-galactosidase